MVKSKAPSFYSDNEPALVATGKRLPDRRQISTRWLIGTLLTGITSCTLMGVALITALHGREQIAIPPELMSQNDLLGNKTGIDGERGARLLPIRPRRSLDDTRRFELATVQKVNGRDVIRSQAFELVNMSLAEAHDEKFSYPKFNALKLFSDAAPVQAEENAAQIYGSKVESEITLQNNPFPNNYMTYGKADIIDAGEANKIAQDASTEFLDKADTLAALKKLSGQHFSNYASFGLTSSPDVKITQENVSVFNAFLPKKQNTSINYFEDIIPFFQKETIAAALKRTGYKEQATEKLVEALKNLDSETTLPSGSILRLGIQSTHNQDDKIIRASIYENKEHIFSLALNDHGEYVRSSEPEMTAVFHTAINGHAPVARVGNNKLPTVYDAVFQATLSYGLDSDIAKQLIRMLANDLDMQSHISSNDSISIFYPVPEDAKTDKDPNILYVKADINNKTHTYYRFQSSDGLVDYYDQDGKSSKQFLLRKPVPNGHFTSPFGVRKHPVLGYVRSHSGVDWGAPRGSPIIAAGDGVVTKVSRSRGYGNHTEIRHANGYVTSYSHQNGFAPGIKEGVKVHQGQIIGYVGSTGLSTGPHCHFEVIVNGTKVDPMRVRLPDAKALKGEQLEAFENERNKIDRLINNSSSGNVRMASVNNQKVVD